MFKTTSYKKLTFRNSGLRGQLVRRGKVLRWLTGRQDEQVLHGVDWGGEGHEKWALWHRVLHYYCTALTTGVYQNYIASIFLSNCKES